MSAQTRPRPGEPRVDLLEIRPNLRRRIVRWFDRLRAGRNDPPPIATILVHRDGNTLWTTSPEMPGCFAVGESWEELCELLGEGIPLWLGETPWPEMEPPCPP
jgi:predicted RNase H-like HicB family nuclease